MNLKELDDLAQATEFPKSNENFTELTFRLKREIESLIGYRASDSLMFDDYDKVYRIDIDTFVQLNGYMHCISKNLEIDPTEPIGPQLAKIEKEAEKLYEHGERLKEEARINKTLNMTNTELAS